MRDGDGIAKLIRQARERPAGPDDPPPAGDAGEGEDEYPSFARLRGPRQVALMLELRLADGTSEALDYGWLARARRDPSAGLVLYFHGVEVRITGKNLRPLYDAVMAHRATWVEVAADPAAAARDPEATVVTAISIEGV